MKGRLFLTLALTALVAACDPPSPANNGAEPDAPAKYQRGEVAKVAEAPDGTILWEVQADGADVYFSSAGTSRQVRQGKVTVTRRVPNAEPEE